MTGALVFALIAMSGAVIAAVVEVAQLCRQIKKLAWERDTYKADRDQFQRELGELAAKHVRLKERLRDLIDE